MRKAERLPHPRCGNRNTAFPCKRKDAVKRFVPGVHGQVEGAVVDREEPAALEVDVGLQGFFRLHVHVGPFDVVGAGFHQGQVERAVLFADAFEAVEVTAVAAEKDSCVGVDHHPRRPQRAVAVEQATAGEVLRWGGDEADACDFGALPPVVLAHLAGVDAPFDQGVAHAEWSQEVRGFGGEFEYRFVVEMVVMVVREDHRFDRWQLVNADRWLVEAFRASPWHWRGPLGEDRVGDPEFVAHLQQQRRVPQAVNAVIGRCEQIFTGQRLHRNGGARTGVARFVENHVPHDPQHFAYPFALHRRMIAKQPLILSRGFRRGSVIRERDSIGHD